MRSFNHIQLYPAILYFSVVQLCQLAGKIDPNGTQICKHLLSWRRLFWRIKAAALSSALSSSSLCALDISLSISFISFLSAYRSFDEISWGEDLFRTTYHIEHVKHYHVGVIAHHAQEFSPRSSRGEAIRREDQVHGLLRNFKATEPKQKNYTENGASYQVARFFVFVLTW